MKRSIILITALFGFLTVSPLSRTGSHVRAQTDKKVVEQKLQDALKLINDGFKGGNESQVSKGFKELKVFTQLAPDSHKVKASALEALAFWPTMRSIEIAQIQLLVVNSNKASEPPASIGAGRVTNGHALKKPIPKYPPIAKTAHASGEVEVTFLIDETGRVTKVTWVRGHPLLQAPAAAAALKSRYSPTLLDGRPVKVTGSIIYNFSSD
jgi:TonB family protein